MTMMTEKRLCPHCGKINLPTSFVCSKCNNLLDVPPAEKETHVLGGQQGIEELSDDYFDQDSTLVLRLRGRDKSFQLTARQLGMGQIIGRNTPGHDLKAHVDLTRWKGEELGVSRRHAYLRYNPQDKTIRVADMGSANGTFVNGQKLHPGEVRVLRHGDRLRLGRLDIGATILHATATVEVY